MRDASRRLGFYLDTIDQDTLLAFRTLKSDTVLIGVDERMRRRLDRTRLIRCRPARWRRFSEVIKGYVLLLLRVYGL
jgi:hypothetical protein